MKKKQRWIAALATTLITLAPGAFLLQPEAGALGRATAGADRIEIGFVGGTKAFKVLRGDEIEQFRRAVVITKPLKAYCHCRGKYLFKFYKGTESLAVLGMHHGNLSSRIWQGQVEVSASTQDYLKGLVRGSGPSPEERRLQARELQHVKAAKQRARAAAAAAAEHR